MFIVTAKVPRKKLLAGSITVLCCCLVVATALILTADREVVTTSTEASGIRSNEDRIAFLAQFGWTVEGEPLESTTVTVPQEFDKVFAAYNELQRAQGLDLTHYSGKTVERYTYKVTNYEGHEGTVLANLLISRGRVIGGDICSAEHEGFVHGFQK